MPVISTSASASLTCRGALPPAARAGNETGAGAAAEARSDARRARDASASALPRPHPSPRCGPSSQPGSGGTGQCGRSSSVGKEEAAL